jgi:hypothetical protein
MIAPDIILESVLRIQRFWRRVAMKNVFRVYKYIFEKAMRGKETLGRGFGSSNSSVIIVCSDETSEELGESRSPCRQKDLDSSLWPSDQGPEHSKMIPWKYKMKNRKNAIKPKPMKPALSSSSQEQSPK